MNWSEKLKTLELQSELILLRHEDVSKILALEEGQELSDYLHLSRVSTNRTDKGWMVFLMLKTLFTQLENQKTDFEILIDKYTRSSREIEEINNARDRLEILGYIGNLPDRNHIFIHDDTLKIIAKREQIPAPDELHLKIGKAVNAMNKLPELWLGPQDQEIQRKCLEQLAAYIFNRTLLMGSRTINRKLKKLDQLVLMLVLVKNFKGQNIIKENDIANLAKKNHEARYMIKELRSGTGPLFEGDYILKKSQFENEFQLIPGRSFLKTYDLDYIFGTTGERVDIELPLPDSPVLLNEFFTRFPSKSIRTEALFFNKDLQTKLDLYKNLLLKEDHILEQHELLTNKINLFFEGPPGCGKTAYAYQLAKLTHRDLYLVNWQTFRHKWIGESEKNLRSILDSIDQLSNNCKRKPIILFNESESFLSRRVIVERSADQGQNNNVSMLLEWMEKSAPSSIVIFTANHKELLDPAFERRINPIAFEHPGAATLLEIWKNKLAKNGFEVGNAALEELNQMNVSAAEIDSLFRTYKLHQVAYDVKGFDLHLFLSFNGQQKLATTQKIGFNQRRASRDEVAEEI